METDFDSAKDGQILPIFATPVAISISLLLLLITVSSLDGREISGEYVSAAVIISLSALLPAYAGRSSKLIPLGSGNLRIISLSIGLLIVSLVANFIDDANFNNMFVASFLILGSGYSHSK